MAACVFVAASTPCFGQVGRETWQPPEKILDAIGVKPGMRVGEAGAGRGYFTFPLARRVGPGGVVFANDISTSSLDVIRERANREGVTNIKIVAGAAEDPLFPEKNLELIVMVYVLHEVEHRVPFLKNLRSYLRPGCWLVIIEGNTRGGTGHTPPFMTNRQVSDTLTEAGYELVRTESFLPRDTLYIYKAPRTSSLPVEGVHAAAAAGDLTVSSDEEPLLARYRKEIDLLKPFGPVDVAILPVSAHTNDIENAFEPHLYLLDELAPKVVYLIGANIPDQYVRCAKVLRARNIPITFPEQERTKGERFHHLRPAASAPASGVHSPREVTP